MPFDTSDVDVVSIWRVGEKLKPLNYGQLVLESGSQDETIRTTARRKLGQYFDLQPEKSAENAKTIDLMEMFGEFSPEQQKALLDNLVGIQLTEGCNGRCRFCLFGTKKGVESKFSFVSLTRFFNVYKDQIRKWGTPNVTHYWDSDPFDYEDGDKSYLDVYEEWRTLFPDKGVYISTTIPKGGVERFEMFMDYIFRHQVQGGNEANGDNKPCEIRISVGKHNVQRVEAVFKDLVSKWEERGIERESIDAFFEAYINFSPRLDGNLESLGSLIEDHDDIYDPSSPACTDGVLLTPAGFESISMTAATIYEPSGQNNVQISPNTPVDQIACFLPKKEYQDYNYPDHLADRVRYDQVLLPLVVTKGLATHELSLSDPKEDIIFKLGRWSFSLSGMMDDIATLETYKHAKGVPNEKRHEYLLLCAEETWKKRWEVWQLVSDANKLSAEEIDSSTKAKLEFYALLTTVQLKKAEYTARLINEGAEIPVVVSTANALNDINKFNVGNLPQILNNVRIVHDRSGKFLSEHKRQALEQLVSSLGFTQDNKPRWLDTISKSIGEIDKDR